MATSSEAPDIEQAALEAQLNELESKPIEVSPDIAPLVAKAKPTADRPAVAPKKDEAAPLSPKQADTLTDAEKAAVETARAEAEKEGKELAVDDKGIPKRDEQGQFVKQDKKPATEPVVQFTQDEEKKFLAWSKQTQSKYQHDATKQLIRWDKIKEAEKAVQTQQANFEKAMAEGKARFDADVVAWNAEKTASQETPDKWLAYSTQCLSEALGKEDAAKKAEAAGNFDQQEALEKEAVILREDAQRCKDKADHLTKNPPLDQAKQQEQFNQHQLQWMQKAGTDFPDFQKNESAVRKEAVEFYKQTVASTPLLQKLPGFIYYCVERANLKAQVEANKTAADRVPVLEKEIGELKQKLTEADGHLNPTPQGGVSRLPVEKKPSERTVEEEYAALQAVAAQMV